MHLRRSSTCEESQRRPDDHARLEQQLQPARDRFGTLGEDDQTAFRDRLSAFVNLYAFLSQILPYGDARPGETVFIRTLLAASPATGSRRRSD